ncbi:lysine-specific demethylase 3A-B [Anopheles darlingi]|uniref:lysine-specific demethylase 3A-B n=1 Tax=Anopheles darlingi TaxID=43151 RepID=UPI0021002162|nr:lysine-specific demethylase 3A-B [Anopheles darlingi]
MAAEHRSEMYRAANHNAVPADHSKSTATATATPLTNASAKHKSWTDFPAPGQYPASVATPLISAIKSFPPNVLEKIAMESVNKNTLPTNSPLSGASSSKAQYKSSPYNGNGFGNKASTTNDVDAAEREILSYQNSLPNAYANQLLKITKNLVEKTQARALNDTDMLYHASGLPQAEIYRRIETKHNDKPRSVLSVDSWASPGDAVMMQTKNSNVLLTLVKPKVTSPAPARVYGAPDVHLSRPAYISKDLSYPSSSNCNEHADGVLNLDTKYDASTVKPPIHPGVNTSLPIRIPKVSNIVTFVKYGNAADKGQTPRIPVPTNFNASAPSCSSANQPSLGIAAIPYSALPLRYNLPIRVNDIPPETRETWENIQKNNLQRLLAQMQSTCNMQLPVRETLVTNGVPSNGNGSSNPCFLVETDPAKKRKNGNGLPDVKKKPRSRPRNKMRPLEPFLQDVPCYNLPPRLPRCRECGRSRTTRTRNSVNIFCRFIAFRKLKYNEIGKVEIFGFADPRQDPGESDTNLWSANLKQVPVDLSTEKSKFLLGQVGYMFCELFHQEKEAYFEHMAEDKTVAWKQAVQGVREMCDVCQTTLFNHHWVCSTCGFVVCLDCYKCRKNGIRTIESTTKDKDADGWLLCTVTKEPHLQSLLMLTQIIPGNCLYKLVHQMHGICALLEIPLNCECPLSQVARFRKIKDKFQFLYPFTMPTTNGGATSGETRGPQTTNVTDLVSVTVKEITPIQDEGKDGKSINCSIVFARHLRTNLQTAAATGTEQGGAVSPHREKQSYNFDGFQQEIRTDGDHFDESLYKLPTSTSQNTKDNLDTEAKVEVIETNDTAIKLDVPEEERHNTTSCESMDSACSDKNDLNSSANDGTSASIECKTELSESTSTEPPMIDQSRPPDVKPEVPMEGNPDVATSGEVQTNTAVTKPLVLPYSEEGRFKPSPPMDAKTFAMIVKQMVKFDQSINIFSTFEKHMATAGQEIENSASDLSDFVDIVAIQRERMHQFLSDFLNDFVLLSDQQHYEDPTNERLILDYNRRMKESKNQFRSKGERKMTLAESKILYPNVAHEWLCNGKLLRLLDPLDGNNYRTFHDQWERGQPVMVSSVSRAMNMDLWMPQSFGRDFGCQLNDLINCLNGKIVRGHEMRVFWEGFERIADRLIDERQRPMMLKLKDWPPGDDFAEMMPTRFYDLMKSLPLAEYTRREGRLNLASRLCSFFVRPDLGPKMYSAYGSALHPNKGTTNLHLDISDAVNVMVYVGVPSDVRHERYNNKILKSLDADDCDAPTMRRLKQRRELPGALWHIYHAQDADKIRSLLRTIDRERGNTVKPNHDPIHDQKWYLDQNMRRRLLKEYNVEGYSIVQCAGDAIFIPAGAPHQVRNLHNCIKVAEDFVSPENIAYCVKLTNEFRHLSKTHSNHEDKLQIKNIIYHTVKDAISSIANPMIQMANSYRIENCDS